VLLDIHNTLYTCAILVLLEIRNTLYTSAILVLYWGY